jgi:hypothetical protein
MSAKLAGSVSQGRKIQTVGRDNNSKIRTQRSTSRGNLRDIRGVRTDRRGGGEIEENQYARPDSRADGSQDGRDGREESKELSTDDQLEPREHGSANKFDGTMKFNRQ